MKKVFFYTAVILAITIALTGCLPKTVGQEPPLPVVNIKALLPENTPEDGTVYIVGNYSDWSFDSAATSTVKTDTEGNKYAEFELQVAEFPLKYKYTVGPDWKYVEKDAEGNEIGDRVIESAPEGVVIDTVASWNAIPTLPVEEPTTVKLKAILPENTPEDGTVYIVGNYCGWETGNAATSEVKVDTENKKYAEFELEISQFPLEYKYTIGPSWDYVEKDAEGNEIGDRVIESAPEGVVIDTVGSWNAIPTLPVEEPTTVKLIKLKAILPENTPEDGTVYIVGNYCGWETGNAATSEVKVDTENKKYAEFELQVAEFPLKYKYTVGPDWKYVEKDADGNEIDDRVIESAPEGVVIDTVGSWNAIPTTVKLKANLPDETPDDATIYIVGNYCDWEPDNAATSTVKTEEGQKYAEFELQVAEFPLEYKYTVGPDWTYVEVKTDGNDLDGNRKIDSAPEGVIEDTVQKWKKIP